jgi:hydrogenase expression/formation protein HypE
MSRDRIKLAHGSGGSLMHELIARVIVPRFGGEVLGRLEDAAELADVGGRRIEGGRLAFTTDSYVVQPLFFPGGDIGKLAIAGTVNDLAVKGAAPACLTLALVIEEGFPIADLERVLDSAAATARDAGVAVVAGDTKVVERGAVGGLIVNTAGIGVIPDGVSLGSERVRDGDSVVVSGTIGDHETAIVIARKGLRVEEAVESDCAAVHGVVAAALDACPDVRVMRDPTRGGLGTTLNEIAAAAGAGITIDERSIPVRAAVRAVCEILGFDPLYMACEGKVVAVVPAEGAEAVVRAMRAHPLGREAAVIGTVGGRRGVYLRTAVGGVRPVVMLEGVQLPRIC